jgi:hypothetical protein
VTIQKGGDLARFMNDEDAAEPVETTILNEIGAQQDLNGDVLPARVLTTGASGPTIMIVGDSFTQKFFLPMLSQHVGRVVWVHHYLFCGVDWSLVNKYRPDEVWWMPVELLLNCDPKVRAPVIPGAAGP